MRKKGRPKKQKETAGLKKRARAKTTAGNAAKRVKIKPEGKGGEPKETATANKNGKKKIKTEINEIPANHPAIQDIPAEEVYAEGLHMSTMQVRALSSLVACKECGEEVILGVRATTKGMINEFTVQCKVCSSYRSTNTPNLIRERKRKREVKDIVLQKTENVNYGHVAAFLDNGLGYSGLKHYCKYFNARCLNEATFIVYARQVIADVVMETEEFLQHNARIIRKAFETQLETDYLVDLTVAYTTTYHQWGTDFCLVAGAVIELQTGLVLDYDVANMYCHVCKINAKKIVSMTATEMTDWFTKHQDTCEIREWCDEIDQETEDGVKEIDPKYLEMFIAKKLWSRSIDKFGFRYTTLIHESDDRIHTELLKAAPYGDMPVLIDSITNCYSRRKSEHARTAFQNKLKTKCPRDRVQTKDRIIYVYAMSIPEYNRFAIGSNIKLRELVRRMDEEESIMEITQAEIYGTVVEENEEDPDRLQLEEDDDSHSLPDTTEANNATTSEETKALDVKDLDISLSGDEREEDIEDKPMPSRF